MENSKLYRVTYEGRYIGAIGIFQPKMDEIWADNEKEAKERFRRRWEHLYEFRFPISVERINEHVEV